MKRIGLLSDTHGYFDALLRNFFQECDEIWHAGDIGNIEIADEIASFKPLVAVHGNIDDAKVRSVFPQKHRFLCEEADILMIHIGGYPGNYSPVVRSELSSNPPSIFISGHSHILKVIHDKKWNFLHINPGAAGKQGFHKFRTAIRFKISGERIFDLEVWEIPR